MEYTEGIVDDSQNVGFLTQFPGIELEQEVGDVGTKALLDPPTEQQAYEASVNAGLIRPTNKAPSPVDNIVVIEDVTDENDVKRGTGEYDVKVQECKLEKTDPETPKI